MAAKKPSGYKVIGRAAVVRHGRSERYFYRDDTFSVDAIDAENAKHLLGVKLIEPVFEADKESAEEKAKAEAEAKAKADAEAAKKKAADDAAKNQTPPAS